MSHDSWHEAASVTITRIVCQLVLSVGILVVCLWLALVHPEYNGAVGLLVGTILGAWFSLMSPRLSPSGSSRDG